MKPIEVGLQDLFRYAYATNCHLDNYCVTSDELSSIYTFSSLELLENFKDLLLNLLNFKKNYKDQQSKESRLAAQFQVELEYHITLQNELRNLLSISVSREEQLVKTHEKAVQRIQELEVVQSNSEKMLNWQQIKEELSEKILDLNYKIDQRESIMHKLESENSRLRTLLEEKFIEIEILKKNMKKKYSRGKDSKSYMNIDVTKKHLEEKALELMQNQQRIRERIAAPQVLRERNRENRKSYNSQDFSSLLVQSSSKHHKRSHSDYKN